jgi:hypothetical protein
MILKARSKWLIAIAAGICGYVLLGPKDTDTAVPTKSAPARTLAAPHAAPAVSAATIGDALQRLTHRVHEQAAPAALFAAHSWYVPPPPPPPVVQGPPPPPVAPPLPFTYMGSYAPAGSAPVFFLTRGDKVYDVHVGDTLDDTYSVDSFSNGQLVLTYKPLKIQQQLTAGTSQ